MEKNAKDSTFIAITNQSSSQEEDVISSDCKDDEQSKVKALEFEIERLMAENKDQRKMLQICDEKECVLKE